MLGLRTLIYGPDSDMAATARDATAKITAVLPAGRREETDVVGLFAMPRTADEPCQPALADLRRRSREERQVQLSYRDLDGRATDRIIYPVALGYYEDRQVLVAWCTVRVDYRRFRIDGMTGVRLLDQHLPEPDIVSPLADRQQPARPGL